MRLRIGPHDVEVVSNPETSLELARAEAYGDSDPARLIIRVQHDLAPSVWRETLVHETIHHVWALTPLAAMFSTDDEERIIRALAPFLTELGFLSEQTRKGRRDYGTSEATADAEL